MTLHQYLRSCSNRYIRPLHIKEECEVCGSKDSLELHHVVPFSQLLEECMESLGLDIRDKKEHYTSKEVINITNWMLGAELRTLSMTLCKGCHTKEHSKQGGFVGASNAFERWVEEEAVRKDSLEDIRVKEIVIPYIEKISGAKLYKAEQEELIEVINSKVNGRQQRSHTKLNEWLDSKEISYSITTNRNSKKRYWTIHQICHKPIKNKTVLDSGFLS